MLKIEKDVTSKLTYIGIDLGGARGKTTAVARLTADVCADSGRALGPVRVQDVQARYRDHQPWCNQSLVDYLGDRDDSPTVAINAPLTLPACLRCDLAECPGQAQCADPAVVWLREAGAEMVEQAVAQDLDRIAAIPATTGFVKRSVSRGRTKRPTLLPYAHRISEVVLHYKRGLVPRDLIGKASGPIAARAVQLRRRLAPMGYKLNDTLLEVSPRATVHALFGRDKARGYKRDADPWETRASIVEGLDMIFDVTSRLSREEVLRNDHCFEALLSGYSAFLRHRDGWTEPADATDDAWQTDGLVWAPPTSR